MKIVIFFFCVLLISCKSSTQAPVPALTENKKLHTDSILIKINNANQDDDSCVVVSNALESDRSYNRLLSQYICSNLYSNDSSWNAGRMDSLTKRPSFLNTILLFYRDNKKFDGISFYDDKRMLRDARENLLFGLKACCPDPLSVIADTLLKTGSFDGLEVLWEKADLKKLPSLDSYLSKVDTGNFFVYADLAAFFHNNNNISLRDTYLKKAKGIKGFQSEYNSLAALVKKEKQFDIVTYKEEIYGGL